MVTRVSGISSGLDTESVISGLVKVKQQPITALETRVTNNEDKITQWSNLEEKLTSLRGYSSQLTSYTLWKQMSADSSDSSVLTGAITATSMDSGSYSFNISKIARAQSGYSNAQTNSTDDLMGTDTATYTINGVDVVINANATLTDIKNAINAKTSEMSTGVKASIINNRLVLANSETGTGHDMSITYKEGSKNILNTIGLIDVTGKLVNETTSEDLTGTMNGIPISSKTNKSSSFIDGATVTFKTAGESTLTVSHDTETLKTLISDFVTAYNEAMDLAKAQGSVTLSDSGDLSSRGKLQGDNLVATLQMNARSLISSQTNTKDTYNSLYTIGVWFDGSSNDLTIDQDKLDKALENNFDDVEKLFRNWGTKDSNGNEINSGVMRKFDDYVYSLIDPTSGSVTMRVENLQTDVDKTNTKIDKMKLDLQSYEDMLWEHFAAMEEAVSKIKSNTTYFSAFVSSS